MIEELGESSAVGNYSVSNIDKCGASMSLPLIGTGFSITPSFSGSYSESYTAEKGTYSDGEQRAESVCTKTGIDGTSYGDLSELLVEPFAYFVSAMIKEAEDLCISVAENIYNSIDAFEAKVEVTRKELVNNRNYVIHIVTTGKSTTAAGNIEPTSYEVSKVYSGDELNLQEMTSDETVFTVGFPHMIYLVDESAEVSARPENERMMNEFPSGDNCKLTISYTLEELQKAGINDINGGNLNIYKYSEELQGYECLGGERNLENKTVSIEIDKPGQFILAVDDDIPVISGIEISDHTSTPTITVYVDEKSGFADFSLKIDDDEIVNADNYKSYYSTTSGRLTYRIKVEDALSDGVHTISVFAVDTAGNGMVSPEVMEFNVHNVQPEIDTATCYTEDDTIRIRAKFKEFGDVFDESVYLEDIAGITAEVTELCTSEEGEPVAITSGFELGMAEKELYITGFGVRQSKDSDIVKYSIIITDVYGETIVKEFDCESVEGTGKVEIGSANNDLWYYMPQSEYEYTGTAIKPTVYVFDGDKLLKEKSDYTLSYKNNTNASKYADESVASLVPVITVNGKGNYSQKDTIDFAITQKNITDDDVIIADVATALSTGKPQKPVTTVAWGKKKLVANKDYKITYCVAVGDAPTYSEDEIIPEAAGEYFVLIKAADKSNYKGQTFKKFTIADKDSYKLISKMSYSKIKDKSYTGEPIAIDSGELVIKDGKDLLVEGADYELIYPVNSADYTDIGTVNVTVAGKGRYVGSKTVSYKITGIPITKATINSELMKRNGFVYDGTSHVLTDLSLTYKFNKTDATAAVLKGIDKSAYERLSSEDRRSYNYVYEYLNNINAGTATVVITGVNDFTGSVKKTFKIGKYTVKKTEPSLIKVSLADDSYEYIYPAVTPKPVVTYLGRILKEGKDYTLAYSNNKTVNDGSNVKKMPTVTIKPTGNFAGVSLTCTFTISQGDLEEAGIVSSAPDKAYADKKGAWKSTVSVVGPDGKKIAAKSYYSNKPVYQYESFTDYDGSIVDTCYDIKNVKNSKNPTYETRSAGDTVDEFDIVPAGTTINVILTGEGNFTGDLVASYRVTQYDIGKLTVTVPATKTYTTREVRLKKSDIVIKKGKEQLYDVTYEIDDSTYKNNINKGKASVVIRGYGEYGGSKTVNYTIGAKQFSWRILDIFK